MLKRCLFIGLTVVLVSGLVSLSFGTFTARADYSPIIMARLSENSIYTQGWYAGANLHLSIDGAAYLADQAAAPCGWDPTCGETTFELGPSFILEPGQEITISDGTFTRSLKVMDLYVETYDLAAKTVSGHSDPGVHVGVSLWVENGWQDVWANGDGSWQASYDLSTGPFPPYTSGDVSTWDEDGDVTVYRINFGNIFAYVQDDWVELQNCTKYRWYTLTIDDSSNGEGVDYWDTLQAGLSGDGTGGYVGTRLNNFHLDIGDRITFSSGHDIRSLVVTSQGKISVDTIKDIISGINQPNSYVSVGTPGAWRPVPTDETGSWSIDYTIPGPNGEPIEDIVPGMSGYLYEYDADADFTAYSWSVPSLTLHVHPQYDLVYATGWDKGVQLIMMVTNDQGQLLTEIAATVGEAPWDPNLPTADFSQTGFDFQPGQILTVSGDGLSKTYRIPDPKTTKIDIAADTVSGTGTPGARILVSINLPDQSNYRWANVDDTGSWTVSFSPSNNPSDSPGSVDIILGMKGGVTEEIDAEGDETWANDWSVPNPTLQVRPKNDRVLAFGWDMGVLLTMSVTDSQGQLLAELTTIVGGAPWDPNLPTGDFFHTGFDFQPGQLLTVSGFGVTKTYLIPNPIATRFDVIADTVSGTGTPGSQVIVCAYHPGKCIQRVATIDETGNWTVNFATFTNPSDSPTSFDLQPGSSGWLDELDAEGDVTWGGDWVVPMPNHGSVTGSGWIISPPGADVAKPAYTGKATFDLSAKYVKPGTLVGSVEFSFKGFVFESVCYDWMAIEGNRVQLTGSGNVNGEAGYSFMINAATDQAGGTIFRIRIWRMDTGQVIYDNMLGAQDNVLPITSLEGGSIKLIP